MKIRGRLGKREEVVPSLLGGPLKEWPPNLEPRPIVLTLHWIVYSALASLIGPSVILLAKPPLHWAVRRATLSDWSLLSKRPAPNWATPRTCLFLIGLFAIMSLEADRSSTTWEGREGEGRRRKGRGLIPKSPAGEREWPLTTR